MPSSFSDRWAKMYETVVIEAVNILIMDPLSSRGLGFEKSFIAVWENRPWETPNLSKRILNLFTILKTGMYQSKKSHSLGHLNCSTNRHE